MPDATTGCMDFNRTNCDISWLLDLGSCRDQEFGRRISFVGGDPGNQCNTITVNVSHWSDTIYWFGLGQWNRLYELQVRTAQDENEDGDEEKKNMLFCCLCDGLSRRMIAVFGTF